MSFFKSARKFTVSSDSDEDKDFNDKWKSNKRVWGLEFFVCILHILSDWPYWLPININQQWFSQKVVFYNVRNKYFNS